MMVIEVEPSTQVITMRDDDGKRWIIVRQMNRGWRLSADGSAGLEEMTDALIRRFGPKSEGHPTIGSICVGCHQEFQIGDYTTLVAIGPGEDKEDRDACRMGRPYNAVAIEIHWACATGDESAESHAYRRW